ncbi:MAG: adenylate/guanylate cyclase domain-containing protein [Geminicoccaceae bacterium]
MDSARVERKLTTILVADAVGYSRAMAADETAALTALRAARAVFARLIERHRGRIFSKAGDGLLAEFPSVVEAVQCAIEVQRELAGRNAAPGATQFRIGVHLGDVMVDGDDLFGDGVNLAARLESMAEPGGVLISQPVYDQVHAKLEVGFDFLGPQRPKNLGAEVPVYRVALDGTGRASPHWGSHRHRAGAAAPPPERAAVEPAERGGWARIRRHAQFLGVVWLGLVVIDLFTGAGAWAQWPGIAMLVLLGLEAAPLLARGWFDATCARLAIIIAGLALINLATWSGTLWVGWPALGLIVLETLRRLRRRR